MLQASLLDDLSFDPFSFQEDGFATSEVGVGGHEVFEALVISVVIVVIDEAFDLSFEVAGQVVVFEQDPVLQRLVPTLVFRAGATVSCDCLGSGDG